MGYITFALAKGRLAEQAMGLFQSIGINCCEMQEKSRKLIFTDEANKIRFFLAKASDVPTYVEYGAADAGIVGRDTLLEENRHLYEVLDLGFGKCKMVVAGSPHRAHKLQNGTDIRVATKYPEIAKKYFYDKKQQKANIIKLNGSVELGPIVGLADVIVDIVETGSTLRANGLEVLEIIENLSARLVINRVSMKMEQERFKRIITNLKKKIEGNHDEE